jgi:hypothetical protein
LRARYRSRLIAKWRPRGHFLKAHMPSNTNITSWAI